MYSARILGACDDRLSVNHSTHKALMQEAVKGKKAFAQKQSSKK